MLGPLAEENGHPLGLAAIEDDARKPRGLPPPRLAFVDGLMSPTDPLGKPPTVPFPVSPLSRPGPDLLCLPRSTVPFADCYWFDDAQEGPTLLTTASTPEANSFSSVSNMYTPAANPTMLAGPARASSRASLTDVNATLRNQSFHSASFGDGKDLRRVKSESFEKSERKHLTSVSGPSAGLLLFSNQVAGRHMMFLSPDGYLCKDASQSQEELEFYLALQGNPCDPLHEFLAEYYGQFYISVRDLAEQCPHVRLATKDYPPNHLLHFLAFQDMTHDMVKPCLADIKMGKQQFAPGAHNEESKIQKSKQTTSGALGFRLSGTKVFDHWTGEYRRQDKHVCRQYTKWQMQDQLRQFFSGPSGLRMEVVTAVIHKLQKLQRHMATQTDWLFFTSSLVLAYDGDLAAPPQPTVVLVDFAHTIPANGQVDHNFLEGLTHLIDVLRCVATNTTYLPPSTP